MICVHFPRWEQTISLPPGTLISAACAAAGHPLDLVCGGQGTCGKCLVEVEENGVSRTVRACQTPISPNLSILAGFPAGGARILEASAAQPLPLDPDLARQYGGQYGFACDLGTTSVVLYACAFPSGEQVGCWSALNGQAALGGDVVARLQAAGLPAQGDELRRGAVDTLNALLDRAARELGADPSSFSALVIAGNSAMQHLLFGFPVAQLATAPYICHTQEAVHRTAHQMGLHLASTAPVTFLPLIGSFVGGDTVAALLATGLGDAPQLRLLLDLGTNGELVLGNREKLLATSAAAGPAMEGAGISCGMRGTTGAIQACAITQEGITLQVIGGGAPLGLCGSGLVAAVAELTRWGVLSPQGRMAAAETFSGPAFLRERLVAQGGQRAFRLAGALLLTQDDVRAFQLSKGAIAAAVRLLLADYGARETDVAEILIAGAFGNYMDVAQARQVGLIPDFPGVPVRSVGNAAGEGAKRYLLSPSAQAAAQRLAAATVHVDLAARAQFTMTFALGMALCPTSAVDWALADDA